MIGVMDMHKVCQMKTCIPGEATHPEAIILAFINREKRAPHWGVQSRFCVITWAELRGPNT